MTTCFDILSKDVKDLTKDEVNDLLQELSSRRNQMVLQGVPYDEANVKASKSVQDDLKIAAARAKKEAAINFMRRQERVDFVTTSFPDDYEAGIDAFLFGSKYWKEGAGLGVDQIQLELHKKYQSGYLRDLERAGLLEAYTDGGITEDIAKALHSISDKEALKAMPQQSVKIATILNKWQEVARSDANKAGAAIGKLDGYIVSQSWSPENVGRVAKQEWIDLHKQWLDLEKMYPNGIDDLDGALGHYYDNIVTGVHEDLGGIETMAGFTGPGNLAKKMSQQRKLHFKSAETWFAANERFGKGTLQDAVEHGFKRMADNTGVMRMLGTNPEYNLKSIANELLSRLNKEARETGNYDKLRKFQSYAKDGGPMMNKYNIVAGKHRSIINHTVAMAFGIARGVQVFSKLQGAGLSTATDPFLAANSARHEGRNFLGALSDTALAPIKRMIDKASGGQREAAIHEIGYFAEGLTGSIAHRFNANEFVPSSVSWLNRMTMKLGLLGPLTDSYRGGAVLGLSGHLASIAPMPYKEVNEQTRRMLLNYGIGEKEWPLLKDAVSDSSGYKIMTADNIRNMDLRSFSKLAEKNIDAVKQGTAARILKRMKQDIIEKEWVSKRAEKLRASFSESLDKLNKRQENKEASINKAKAEITDRLLNVLSRIDEADAFWQSVRNTNISKVVKAAKSESSSLRAISRAERKIADELNSLLANKASLEIKFEAKWEQRINDLNEQLEKTGDIEEANARLGKYDELFMEANAKITERLKDADQRNAIKTDELRLRVDSLKERIDNARAVIEAERRAQKPVSSLRKEGRAEGISHERSKDLRADIKQLDRDLAKFKKKTGEDFVTRWGEKQAAAIAFADGIDERIKARAEDTDADLARIDPLVTRQLEDAREELATKFGAMMFDRMNHSIISPTARTEYITTGGGKSRGDVVGEAIRSVFTFKSFSIAFWQNAMQQELYSRGATKLSQIRGREMGGLVWLMTVMTAGGYLAMTAKDWAKGKKARSVDDGRTWLAAAIQGGGMGLYTDFIFGEKNRYGQSPIVSAAGPVVGDVADIIKIMQSTRDLAFADEDAADTGALALRFGLNHTPFINLFYTQTLLNHMLFYQWQENLNPGYLRRFEKRIEKDTGAKWNIRPTEAVR